MTTFTSSCFNDLFSYVTQNHTKKAISSICYLLIKRLKKNNNHSWTAVNFDAFLLSHWTYARPAVLVHLVGVLDTVEVCVFVCSLAFCGFLAEGQCFLELIDAPGLSVRGTFVWGSGNSSKECNCKNNKFAHVVLLSCLWVCKKIETDDKNLNYKLF